MNYQTYESKLHKLQMIEDLLERLDDFSDFAESLIEHSDIDKLRKQFVKALESEHTTEIKQAKSILHELKIA